MLGLLDKVSSSWLEDQKNELSYESCSDKKAEIFQPTGNYFNLVNSSLMQIIFDSIT